MDAGPQLALMNGHACAGASSNSSDGFQTPPGLEHRESTKTSSAPATAMPLTPPESPPVPLGDCDKHMSSQASVNSVATNGTVKSHQEYLDSLQLPSKEEFKRLASLQAQREKELKQKHRELQRESAVLARKSFEARKDLMETLQQQNHDRAHDSRRSPSQDSRGHVPTAHHKAATVIQRSYRGYRTRREMKGMGLDASTRWTHAIRDALWRDLYTPKPAPPLISDGGDHQVDGQVARPSTGTSAAKQKWRKAAAAARRAGNDTDSDVTSSDETSEEGCDKDLTPEELAEAKRERARRNAKRRKKAQVMGLSYFLEMVDVKHRYGSNLRQYHEQWKKSDTSENYFYWLDYGGGKDVELESCSREQLEREQVRYLSKEERQAYLVQVDPEGRLCWAKNGVRIDTTEEWKDSLKGIVPIGDSTPAFEPTIDPRMKISTQGHPREGYHSDSDASSTASSGSDEAAQARKYATPGLDEAKGVKKIKHVSAATIFNKLLRKSVKKNTWIFVADTSFRLYVGIKSSGAFQHSSFLQGSRISAAGLIKAKDGRLKSLSPLSGHYRPPTSNFRAFVHSLRDEGVDMSHVSISKSYAVLVGLEMYVKARRKGKEAVAHLTHRKEKILDPEAVRRKEEEERDKSESAAKEREVLQREETAREENKAGVRFMQKLGLRPREPDKMHHGSGH